MKIFFCPDCGAYSLGPASSCDECQKPLPEDSWAEVTEEELQQLEYAEQLDMPGANLVWEYDVVKLKPESDPGGLDYSTAILKTMGQRGWELVNITPLGFSEEPRYGIFKRCYENFNK